MLKDIVRLHVTGGNFEPFANLDIFYPWENGKNGDQILKTIKGSVLYGRNGSGKSTIAKAFRKLSGENVSNITNVALYDPYDNQISLTDEDTKRIFIFDEDFVDKNIKLQEDHLETIILLGAAGELSEKIKEATINKESLETALSDYKNHYNKFVNKQNIESPYYYINEMTKTLREDGGWAERDKKIKGNSVKSAVNDTTYLHFVDLNPSESKTDLLILFNEKLSELNTIRSGKSTIDNTVPSLDIKYINYNDETIHQLLTEQIEKPELSEREKKIFSILSKTSTNDINERLTTFKNTSISECPYCFQPLEASYKENLIESIEKILNRTVKEHQLLLKNNIIDSINIDLESYAKLDSYELCSSMIIKINILIETNNNNILKKYNNPYEIIIDEITNIKTLAVKLSKALELLEQERNEYNKTVKKTEPLIKQLNVINGKLTYLELKDSLSKYKAQKIIFSDVSAQYKQIKSEYTNAESILNNLESERKNINIAVDSINACLKYVFFSEDRLKIVCSDGVYKLLSHGKNVKPCEISVGERNIIGLCYFFISILEGQDPKIAYNKPHLIIIDDPVSSYDIENKVGILSFLKYKLEYFLTANAETGTLVMTHDLQTFYDLYKIFEEIFGSYPKGTKFLGLELSNNNVAPFQYKKRQEYTELLKVTYNYALGNADNMEIVIGNMMRQVLETFSTFQYKKGIEAVSTDNDILELLGDEKYTVYYKNLMYRLVLHGGSHREEQVKTINDLNFFEFISPDEKKRTAKEIICFLYLLNKKHVSTHLDDKNASKTITAWCEEIKNNSTPI